MNTIEKALNALPESTSYQKGDPLKPDMPSGQQFENSDVDLEIDLVRMRELGMLTPGVGRSAIAEEYRHIKRPLLRNILSNSKYTHRDSNLIMVSSALPGEGKTFTSINLAMSIAMELDHTCLLVDADVARPSILKTMGLHEGERKGLVDYLSDSRMELSEVMLKTNVPKLNILPAGQVDPQATELLSSESMRQLVLELSERYHDRIVVFDLPPLLVTSESHALVSMAGQIVLVVEALRTRQSAIKQAVSFLDKEKYIGLVLNKNRMKAGYGYYYGYGYSSYGDDEKTA